MCLFNELSFFNSYYVPGTVRCLGTVMNLSIKLQVMMRNKKKAKDLALGDEEILLRRHPQHVQNNRRDK